MGGGPSKSDTFTRNGYASVGEYESKVNESPREFIKHAGILEYVL